MQSFKHAVEFTCNACAGVFLLVLMFLTFADVTGRNFFDHPLLGATELTEYALAVVTFLSYPVVSYRRQHISVDLFDRFVGKTGQRVQQVVGDLLGGLVFGVLSYRFWIQGTRLMSYGDETPQLGIPIAPAYFFMSVMAAVTVAAFLLAAWEGHDVAEDTIEARQGTM
jgi:TRAP-type C4-dicarboxylate transport system permease small subunit